MAELVAAFRGLPPFARLMLAGTLTASVLPAMKLLPGSLLIHDPRAPSWLGRLMQPWRLVTPFWFQPMGMSLLTSAYFLTIYTRQLEQGFFRGRPADMAFFLVIAMLAHLVLADVYQLVVLAQPLLLTIVYVASQHLGDQPVSFLYGLQFRAFLLPWALAALDLAFSGNLPVPALIGIFVGHAYWYAQVDWPRAAAAAAAAATAAGTPPREPLLPTPRWFADLTARVLRACGEDAAAGGHGSVAAAAPRTTGRGVVLGGRGTGARRPGGQPGLGGGGSGSRSRDGDAASEATPPAAGRAGGSASTRTLHAWGGGHRLGE